MLTYRHMGLAASWLSIWVGAMSPAAAEPAVHWHAKCVDEIRRENWGVPPPPGSIELAGETVRVIAVPSVPSRINKTDTKCAARIIDAFRMVGTASVSFSIREIDTLDYNKEQCSREARRLQKEADTRLITYVNLVLKCVPNKQNAAKIREWLDADKARKIGYRNLDFRLFELAFAKSEPCRDQKDFVAYYECFANAISEADLSKPQAVILAQSEVDALTVNRPQEATPAPVQAPRRNDGLSPVAADRSQNGDDNDPPSRAVVRTSSPPAAPTPSLEPLSAAHPETTDLVAGSTSLLRDYLLLLVIVTISLTLFAVAWNFAVRRSAYVGDRGIEQGSPPAEPQELSPSQRAIGVHYRSTDGSPTVPDGSAVDTEAVQELKIRLMTMESQISEFKRAIAVRDRDLGTAGESTKRLLSQVSALEAKYREQLGTLQNSTRDLQDQLTAQRTELIKEQDARAALRHEFSRREDDFTKQRAELTLKCGELTQERELLRRQWEELAAERDNLLKQRDELAGRLEFINSQAERLKSGLPLFISPADLGNPLSEFWVTSSKADPQAHSRLEGALRSYKIASDDSLESSGKLFELVNDIGVQLYALMDAIAFDESRKREVAANWQVALNRDGDRRFIVSVPWPGTPIEPLEVVRKDQRCRSERINCVRSWIVKDKDGRVARRAIVE